MQVCPSMHIGAAVLNAGRPPIQVDRDGEPNQFLTCRPRVICLERGDTWLKLSVDVVAAWEGPK